MKEEERGEDVRCQRAELNRGSIRGGAEDEVRATEIALSGECTLLLYYTLSRWAMLR